MKGLDWIGGVLFTIGAVLVLVGMVYTSYLKSTDARVLATLCVGFAFIIAFGLWERLSGVKFPLCPNEIFTARKGREFTIPFCLTFIVVGFFYGTAVIYPTMLSKYDSLQYARRANCTPQMPSISTQPRRHRPNFCSRFRSILLYLLELYC